MNWIEATIQTKREEIEEISEKLTEIGIQGLWIEDEADLQKFLQENREYWDYVDESLTEKYRGLCQIKFYLAEEGSYRETIRRIEAETQKKVQTSVLPDTDWENTWKESFDTLEIGARLQIIPQWREAENGARIPIVLNQGMAFGTGYHATTKMCLETLEELNLKQAKVLDLGFGSGILTIAALKLGAESVSGCDIDPNARTAAKENAALNQIPEERLQLYSGNLLTDMAMRKKLGSGYSLVMANIVADVILPLIQFAADFLAPDGKLLCSGIIDNRSAEIETALEKNGYTILKHLQEDEWNCYLAEKTKEPHAD